MTDAYLVDGVAFDSGRTRLHRLLPCVSFRAKNLTVTVIKALNGSWSQDYLHDSFRSLDAVEELHIWGRSRGIVTALVPLVHKRWSVIVLPFLKTLVANAGDYPESLDGEIWDVGDSTVACHHGSDFGAGWMLGLIPVLQARTRSDVPILRLVINGSLDCRGVVNTTRNETCARVTESDLDAL